VKSNPLGINGLAVDNFDRPLSEMHTDDYTSPFVTNVTPSTTPAGPVPPGATNNTATYAYSALAYDADGNVSYRDFDNPTFTTHERQIFTWDEFGRLAKVEYRTGATNITNWANATGYNWTPFYDALGRRTNVTYQPIKVGATGAVSNNGTAVTVRSWFDPLVEFLEIGVQVNTGDRYWKLCGPDANGVRGALQGIGGLEAFVDENTGVVTGMLNNYFGDSLGWSSLAGGNWGVSWNNARPSAWGLQPKSFQDTVNAGKVFGKFTATTPWEATVWRGKRIELTGLYWNGARYYDQISGRFISPDPAGHAGSMDLYSYANGDPVNNVDPDGRLSLPAPEAVKVNLPDLSGARQYNMDGFYGDPDEPPMPVLAGSTWQNKRDYFVQAKSYLSYQSNMWYKLATGDYSAEGDMKKHYEAFEAMKFAESAVGYYDVRIASEAVDRGEQPRQYYVDTIENAHSHYLPDALWMQTKMGVALGEEKPGPLYGAAVLSEKGQHLMTSFMLIVPALMTDNPGVLGTGAGSGTKLFWHGSADAVARREAAGVFVDGPGNSGLFWATSKQMEELGPFAWKVGGNMNVQLLPPRLINKGGLEATYSLTPGESAMFSRAWGFDFNWNPYQWWKGAVGQYYYRSGPASLWRRFGELGKGAGMTGTGYLLYKATHDE
jgi:RHS repeat-associated protein